MEHLELEPAPKWHAGVIGAGCSCWATVNLSSVESVDFFSVSLAVLGQLRRSVSHSDFELSGLEILIRT